MIINGIDLAGLCEEIKPEWRYPEAVEGRVAHIDADFLAYQVSYEKADGSDTKSLEDMHHNAELVVEHLKKMSGATQVHMHLTPSTSDKGGRYDVALQKEYQGNRADKEKPRYLHIMRDFLAKKWPGTQYTDCEADDGMSSMQYKAIADGRRNLSIIVTKDKDLSMVPGLHVDWSTGEITDVEGFGSTWLDAKGKLRGWGTKFFWAQMLIGDSADNTQGLPLVPGMVMNKIKPTAQITKALTILKSGISKTDPAWDRQMKVLTDRAPAKCGPATAQLILELCNNDKQALIAIEIMYRMIGETVGYKDYRTGAHVSWLAVFNSEAILHWMRRDRSDQQDVLKWMEDIRRRTG